MSSANLEKEALRLFIEGCSRDEIASQLGVSTGTASSLINKAKVQADAYNIDPEKSLDAIRHIAKRVRNLDSNWSELADVLHLDRMMKRSHITPEQMRFMIGLLSEGAKNQKVAPQEIGRLLEAIQVFCTDSKDKMLTVTEATQALDHKKEEMSKVDQDLERGLQELEHIRIETKRLTTEVKTNERQLRKMEEVDRELAMHGLSLEKAGNIHKVLNNIEEAGQDARLIVHRLLATDSARKDLELANQDLIHVKKQLDDARKLRDDYLDEAQRYANNLDAMSEAESLGFDPKRMRQLTRLIQDIADKNKITSSKALEKFFSDIGSYDSLIGFETACNILQVKIERRNRELILLSLRYDAEKDAVNALVELRAQELTVEDIMMIHTIVVSSFNQDNSNNKDDDLMDLYEAVRERHSLKAVIESLMKEKGALDEDLKQQKEILDGLKEEETEIEQKSTMMLTRLESSAAQIQKHEDSCRKLLKRYASLWYYLPLADAEAGLRPKYTLVCQAYNRAAKTVVGDNRTTRSARDMIEFSIEEVTDLMWNHTGLETPHRLRPLKDPKNITANVV